MPYRSNLRIPRFLFLLSLVGFLGAGLTPALAQINFGSSDLVGEDVQNPTSLQFGPDDRLYVLRKNGSIDIFTVVRNAPNDYEAIANEVVDLVKQIPNHDDDGQANSGERKRQATGLLVTGTATNPVMYVGSSDPRVGAGGGATDTNLDSNSGVISRLMWTGTEWDKVDLVRGLPRSEENHANNGMQLSPDGTVLYVAQGGHTNAGAPSNNFAFATEYALAAAILSVDLVAIAALPTLVDAAGTAYKYDIPTLDDPTRTNANGIDDPAAPGYDGIDTNDPWGGNDGLNQSVITPSGPVQVHSPGWRNPYDVVITKTPGRDGRMYAIDNGSNGGWGGHPIGEADYPVDPDGDPVGGCTNEYLASEPGSTGPGTGGDPKVNNLDNLHLVTGPGFYAGHPNPVRGNPTGAGLFTYDGTGFWRTDPADLPPDWPPVPAANPIECDFRNPGETDGALYTWANSTNGLAEYSASNFSQAMQGDLLTVSFDGNLYRIELNAAGDVVTNVSIFASSFGDVPLDVTAQPDDGIFPGTVWAITYIGENITVFEPADYDGGGGSICTGDYDNLLDEDGDGYTNADEIDNATDPCSAASKPADFDRDLVSNLNDPDDDNDGTADTLDPFAHDAEDGLTTNLPIDYPLFNDTPGFGFFGLGFTGLMSNGTSDYLNLYDPALIIAGGAAGLFTIDGTTSGNATGSTNTQEYAFQFGVNVDLGTNPFTVSFRLLAPFFDGITPSAGQQQGAFIGTGDQDNYLRVALVANDGDGGLEVVLEEAGSVVSSATYGNTETGSFYIPDDVLSATNIDLLFSVDPTTGTVQPRYSADGAPPVALGSPLAVSGVLLDAMQSSTSALALGVTSTSAGGSPFTATWDYIEATFDPSNSIGAWSTVTSQNAPTARHESAFVQAGDKFYVLGGRGNRKAQEYNLATATWSDGTAPPFQLHHFQAVEHNGLIYAIGAYTDSFPTESFVDHIYIYDPVSNLWHQGPEIPESRRRGSAAAVAYNGLIYMVGGSVGGHGNNGVRNGWFDAFDLATNTWTVLPDAPHVRDHAQAAVIGDKLYLAGGRDGSLSNSVAQVDVYDFTAGQWSSLASPANDLPTPRSGAAVAVLGNELLVIGGESDAQSLAHSETEAFNVTTQTWRSLAPLNTGRHGTQAIVSNQGVYVAAGSGQTGGSPELSSQEAFYIDGQTSPSGTPLEASTLFVSPEILEFGVIPVGNTASLNVTLSNTAGTQAIAVTGFSFTGSPDFSIATSQAVPFILPPGASTDIRVEFVPSSEDPVAGQMVIAHSGDNAPPAISLFGGEGVASVGEPLYRVNAGGKPVADNDLEWGLDTKRDPSPYSNVINGGNTARDSNASIANATGAPDALFTHYRWDEADAPELAWAFPVPANEPVELRLYFAELDETLFAVGARVFDVVVEGAVVLDDYDVFAVAGERTVAMASVTATASDGVLDVEFIHVIQHPFISAIEVFSSGNGLPTNTPPVVSNPGDQLNEEGDVPSFNIAATDSDGPDILSYSAIGFPPGIDVEPTSGNILGTVDVGAALGSPYAAVVTVSDGVDTTQVTFSWTVTAPDGPNTPPSVEPIADVMVTEGDSVIVAVAATDANLDPVVLSVEIAEDGSSTLTGNEGSATATRISSNFLASSEASLQRKGELNVVGHNTGNGTTMAGTVARLTEGTNDAASALVDPASYTFTDNGDGTGLLEWPTSSDAAGVYTATVLATDGIDTTRVIFTITLADHLPTITVTAPSDGALLTDNEVTITWMTYGVRSSDHVHVTLDTEPYIGGQPLNGSWTFSDLAAGEHMLHVQVASEIHQVYTNPEASQTISVTAPEPPPPSVALYRINAGGKPIADNDLEWGLDTKRDPSPYSNVINGGNTARDSNASIANATGAPDALFTHYRWDEADAPELAWAFPVPANEPVELRLYFAELDETLFAVGARVFDVVVEGAVVLDDYDVFAVAGGRAVVMETVTATASDGVLDVEFIHVYQHPFISAIEVFSSESNVSSTVAEASSTETLRVDYSEGWNLVGLPFALRTDTAEALFSGATAVATAEVSGRYELLDVADLRSGQNYWLNLDQPKSTIVAGERTEHLALSLHEGWNLISGWSCTIPANAIYANADVVPHTLFGFAGAYHSVTQLLPGSAYWVLTTATTTLELSCSKTDRENSPGPPAFRMGSDIFSSKASNEPDYTEAADFDLLDFAELTVSDARGRSYSLYFGSSLPPELSDLPYFSLPPLPPPSAFDVRLAGDLRLSESANVFAHVQATDSPLSVVLDGPVTERAEYEVEVYAKGHPIAVYSLSVGNPIVIEERGVDALFLRTTTEAVPAAFALTAVYPNPVVDEVNITFDLPEPANVKLEIYDVLGRRIHSAEKSALEAGANHVFRLRATSLTAGAYFFRLVADMPSQTRNETGRITVVR